MARFPALQFTPLIPYSLSGSLRLSRKRIQPLYKYQYQPQTKLNNQAVITCPIWSDFLAVLEPGKFRLACSALFRAGVSFPPGKEFSVWLTIPPILAWTIGSVLSVWVNRIHMGLMTRCIIGRSLFWVCVAIFVASIVGGSKCISTQIARHACFLGSVNPDCDEVSLFQWAARAVPV